MAKRWVIVKEDPATDRRRRARSGERKYVFRRRGDVATESRLARELRKSVEQLSPEERQALRERFAPARRLSKAERPDDVVAESGIVETKAGARVLDLERQDGSSTLVGGGEVTRLELGQQVKKGERKGYCDDAISGVTPAPPDVKPDTQKLN